ncbi:F0F1 ATP synthase subunit B [Exilibacterium tricleocarpae]|uniref:ATP synthase subunit b n=1 Tax=Exilibacterium tricleocarpae TaxID=2591008 RepID=A0A545TZT6_9GAMM|nr:F0F1 ATP synthase subunit B [Exilibacterium tricleocarpae]TQV82703.1 F0F1 ATP synthase subunit B [Exilibacterium tricleocarpae]
MNINLTLIGQSITFIIFILFCMKYVWPMLLNVMQEREKKIADGLDAAEMADKDLELAKQKATQQLREAKEQAAALIEQANKRAGQIIDEAKDQARAEGERLKAAAQAEIEQNANRAKEELRGKVAALALVGAEKVLQASIDKKAHNELLDKLAADL